MATNVIFNSKNVIFNNKNVVFGESETPAATDVTLWSDGTTTAAGTWSTMKNSLTRGQTFTFNTTQIATTANTSSNSSHGTLIYPANPVSILEGDYYEVYISNVNDGNVTVSVVDSNVTTWTFYIAVVFLEEIPASLPFNVVDWVNNQDYKKVLTSTSASGGTASKTINKGTYYDYVPATGTFYPCLVVYGYDSKTTSLRFNDFTIVTREK